MPQITSIKPQKNNRRLNIYLDGKFGFGLDLENFVKLGLKVEQELTDTQVEEVVKKAEFQKIYEKILRFASLRPRSEKEFKNWLQKYKVHDSLYKDLFDKLKYLDFLDDRKFAVWWVEQRLTFRPKSKLSLKFELKGKGIDENLIKEVLFETKVDEVKLAKDLIEKKRYKWEKLDNFEARRKMSEFLARKGFNWEIIRKILDINEE